MSERSTRAELPLGEERIVYVRKVLEAAEAGALVGTTVGSSEPTFRSPREGEYVRIVDEETEETAAIVTALPSERRQLLRAAVRASDRYLGTQLRANNDMLAKGVTFGYLPKKPQALRESCAQSAFMRDAPSIEQVLDDLALDLAEQFPKLHAERAAQDFETIENSLLSEWRLGENSLWTSGVINKTAALPYHRDGNNFDTWSAMPSIRRGLTGGHLHLPEYDLTLPISDGDVSWFLGKRLVHGVTPMAKRKGARSDPYRYTCVFYAVQGLKDCRTYAEETRLQAERRTERERRMAEEARAQLGMIPEAAE